jgi:dipeptidyl aminopeptidase/acylaminoacyl peptidase
MRRSLPRAQDGLRAAARAAVFLLKVFPMIPSRPIDWVTPAPTVDRVRYPTSRGLAEGDLYRPSNGATHPGIVVCLGVVPFEVDHPQVPRLGAALARAGFAALLYWSPAMRDRRLVPEDVGDLTLAYEWLIGRDFVDPARSGLLGTCVGGSFALMAAADASIRDRVAFVAAFAPYASVRSMLRDIGSASTMRDYGRRPWTVDPLTRTVFVRSVTDVLERDEAEHLRAAFLDGHRKVETESLSEAGRRVYDLLCASDVRSVDGAIEHLPAGVRERLDAMSPLRYVEHLHAPLIAIAHDRDDAVIPVDESRRLRDALLPRDGVDYTEFTMFEHADPTKRRLSPLRAATELLKFYRHVYPVFRSAC